MSAATTAHSPVKPPRPGPGLVVAALLPLVALALQWLLWPWLDPYAWLLYFPAVFAAAWVGGYAGGWLATALSALLVWYFFIPPQRSWRADDIVGSVGSTALFLVVGVLVGEAQRRLMQERRRSAQALDDANAARAQLTKFSRAIEQTVSTVVITDANGRIEYVNPRFSEASGYSAQEAIGRSTGIIKSGRTPEATYKQLWATIRSGAVWKGEFLNQRKDGSLYREAAIISPIRDEAGRITHYVSIQDDVTAIRQAEAELRAARSEMEQLLTLHVATQTAAAIAHEMNQPLNAIAAYTEAVQRMLDAGVPRPERLRHALSGCAHEVQRAGQVMRELMRFLHKGESASEPVDLNTAVRRALAIVEADGYGGFHAEVDLADRLGPVLANRMQVEKVLVTLIHNAVEAMRQASIEAQRITIIVRTASDGDMAQLTLRDVGPGIDHATAQRIFAPFFSTKPNGLGMGLAISRSLIEAHGGRLWVDPPDGEGATFHFTLPFVP